MPLRAALGLGLVAITSCGGTSLAGDRSGDDIGDAAEGEGDVVRDAIASDAPDVPGEDALDGYREEGTVFPPIEDVPGCGNGVLDPGEECDDRNRLDGDGCTWNCRLGDGDPPPDPDPTAADYEPAGDSVPVGDPGTTVVGEYPSSEVPLVWTGTEFATAYEGDGGVVRFRRFDEAGHQIEAEWVYDEGVEVYDGHDLVWTGDGFGLFLIDESRGIVYMRLEPSGKPVGEPIVVEADPLARAPTAAWGDGRFALAWVAKPPGEGWSPCGDCDVCGGAVRVKNVEVSGAVRPSSTIETRGGAPPNIVRGEGGFGLVLGAPPTTGSPCSVRFVRLNDGLSDVVSSGVLVPTLSLPPMRFRLPVVNSDGSYAVAWTDCRGCEPSEARYNLCLARFTSGGDLARSPVCNAFADGIRATGDLAMAAGDGGFLAVWEALGDVGTPTQLLFARLDGEGRSLASAPRLLVADVGGGLPAQPVDVAWSGDSFGVLYGTWSASLPPHLALFLRLLRPVTDGPALP